MSKITAKKWNGFTAKQKYDYLVSRELVVSAVAGIPANAKVNEDCKCIINYHVKCGGVFLSNPQPTRSGALLQAEDSIKYWFDEAAKESN
jgi:hypothetical protein